MTNILTDGKLSRRGLLAGAAAGGLAMALGRPALAQEGMSPNDHPLSMIARAADGSMRDALSLTDQVLALGGGTLSVEQTDFWGTRLQRNSQGKRGDGSRTSRAGLSRGTQKSARLSSGAPAPACRCTSVRGRQGRCR